MRFLERTIELKSFNDSFTLLPFCCVHFDSDECHRELFKQMVARASDKDVYTIGLGDLFDHARSRYRIGLRKASPDSTSSRALDDMVYRHIEELLEVAKPLFSGRMLGMVEGNHYHEFQHTDCDRDIVNGETQQMRLCRLYNIPYLAELAVITLYITFADRPRLRDIYVIYASHGTRTGGSTVGSDIGNMERKVEPLMEADCYMTGHTHRRIAHFLPKMVPCGKKFIERPHLLIKAGSFLRGFVPDRVTYASEAGYRPLDLGWQEIHFSYAERDHKLIRKVTTSMSSEVSIGTIRGERHAPIPNSARTHVR